MELDPWEPHEAIFAVLTASCARRGSTDLPSPNLHDATRAMELAEATVRSLRRGRTVDLHYEPISEESNFKSVMTSTGCMILLGALVAVLFALSGPPLGLLLDDLHRLPDSADPGDLHGLANAAVRRPKARVSRKRPARRSHRRTRMSECLFEGLGTSTSLPNLIGNRFRRRQQ